MSLPTHRNMNCEFNELCRADLNDLTAEVDAKLKAEVEKRSDNWIEESSLSARLRQLLTVKGATCHENLEPDRYKNRAKHHTSMRARRPLQKMFRAHNGHYL